MRGLDIIGASVTLGASAPDGTAAANHAIAAGTRFAKKRSRGGNKLIAAGKKMLTKQQAIKAQTAAAGKLTPPPSPVNAAAGRLTPPRSAAQAAASLSPTSPTSAIRTAATATTPSRSLQAARMAMMGFDLSSAANLALNPNTILSLDAAATVADLGNGIVPLVDQVTPINAALGVEGNAILDHCQNVIDAWDPDAIDASLGNDVKQIQNDIASWTPRAQAAVKAGPASTATAPTIQSVVNATTGVPNSGNPGEQVTITGTNLTGASAVTFGGAAAQFVVNSATQITATIPPNPAPGFVTVATPNGNAQSTQTFTLSSSTSYGGDYGGGGGYGGSGGYGGGSADYGSGAADQGSDYGTDQAAYDDAVNQAEGGDDGGGGYEFSQSTLDRSYGGYGSSVDQGDDGGGYVAPAPRPAPAAAPVTVAEWAKKDAYSKDDVVSYHGKYYRAMKDVSSRWLFSNDAPDKSDAWASLSPKKATAQVQPDIVGDYMSQAMTTPSSGTEWGALAVDPTGISYGLYKAFGPQWEPEAYQPRYHNTYWQNHAQNPFAAALPQRLALAQQLQQSLQSQLAARYAALAAATTPATTQPQLVGEYGMSKKINGPALCGFADYFASSPLVGLSVGPRGAGTSGLSRLGPLVTHVPQKGALSHGITIKRSPNGNPISSLHINAGVLHRRDPATVQHAAQMAVQHAQTVAKNTLSAVNRVATQKKAPAPHAAVHGIGAAAVLNRPGKRPPTPHHVPAASLTQLKTQAQALQKAAGKVTSAAGTFKKQTDTAKSKQTSAITHQKSVTKLHGIIGADAYGFVPGQPGYDATTDPTSPSYNPAYGGTTSTSPPNPNDPGYLMDGSPDPAYGGGGLTTGVSQVPGPPDYGAGPSPTVDTVSPQVDIDYISSAELGADDYAQFYTSDPSGVLANGSMGSPVPLGAIYFDGSRPLPFQGVGNATVFYGTLPGGQVPKGGPNSGYEWHGSGGFDWALVLQGSGGGYGGNKNYDKVGNPDYGMISESQKNGWGPLIGKPGQPDTDGLRFDVAKMAFFWPYDKAPAWAQAPVKQAAFNAAVVAWKAAQLAGQADYVAAQLQDKLDAQTAQDNARQQAQQDIGLAMQQQQFDAQQAQAQAALDMQMQQADAASQAQYSQLDAQQAAIDQQLYSQQAQADLAAQQQQDQLYFQQQQKMLSSPQAQVYDDGGGDQGYTDDGNQNVLDDGASPEAASDQEAASIEAGDTLVGAVATVDTYLRNQRLRDEGAVGGDGELIGIDDYGNLTD